VVGRVHRVLERRRAPCGGGGRSGVGRVDPAVLDGVRRGAAAARQDPDPVSPRGEQLGRRRPDRPLAHDHVQCHDPSSDRRRELFSDETAAIVGGEHPALDDVVRVRALLAWSSLYGTISVELFGQLVGSVADVDRYSDVAIGEFADLVGL
jgi:WHG domain-containing protein